MLGSSPQGNTVQRVLATFASSNADRPAGQFNQELSLYDNDLDMWT